MYATKKSELVSKNRAELETLFSKPRSYVVPKRKKVAVKYVNELIDRIHADDDLFLTPTYYEMLQNELGLAPDVCLRLYKGRRLQVVGYESVEEFIKKG